jgi:hypothetical protein
MEFFFHFKAIRNISIDIGKSILNRKFLHSSCPCALTEHHAIKAYWGNGGIAHSLISALDGGEWSASRPGRFTPRERAPGTLWIGGLVGPRAVLDAVVKRKIPSPPPGIEL